jgi:hypothetical protein
MAEAVHKSLQPHQRQVEVSDELLRLLRGINEKLGRVSRISEFSLPGGHSKVASNARKPSATEEDDLRKRSKSRVFTGEDPFRWYEFTHRGQDWIGMLSSSFHSGRTTDGYHSRHRSSRV